ncbi:hypothetical protein [Methylocella sp.]
MATASYTSGARTARDIARDPLRSSSADYDAALALQARLAAPEHRLRLQTLVDALTALGRGLDEPVACR